MMVNLEELRKAVNKITKEELIDYGMYTEEEIKRDNTIMDGVKEVFFDLLINEDELTEKLMDKVEYLYELNEREVPSEEIIVKTYNILKDAEHPLVSELQEFVISNYEMEVLHSVISLEPIRKEMNERAVDYSLQTQSDKSITLNKIKSSVLAYINVDIEWIAQNERGSLNRMIKAMELLDRSQM